MQPTLRSQRLSLETSSSASLSGWRTDLKQLVEPVTRGNPESPLRWTSKSARRLAAKLRHLGHEVGDQKVAFTLQDFKHRLQSDRKTKWAAAIRTEWRFSLPKTEHEVSGLPTLNSRNAVAAGLMFRHVDDGRIYGRLAECPARAAGHLQHHR